LGSTTEEVKKKKKKRKTRKLSPEKEKEKSKICQSGKHGVNLKLDTNEFLHKLDTDDLV